MPVSPEVVTFSRNSRFRSRAIIGIIWTAHFAEPTNSIERYVACSALVVGQISKKSYPYIIRNDYTSSSKIRCYKTEDVRVSFENE